MRSALSLLVLLAACSSDESDSSAPSLPSLEPGQTASGGTLSGPLGPGATPGNLPPGVGGGLGTGVGGTPVVAPTMTAIPPPPPPDPFEANFLWQELVFDDAERLDPPPERVAEEDQIPAGPVAFERVTDQVGLDDADSGGNPNGVGLAFADVDGDSWQDLIIVNGQIPGRNGDFFDSRMYRNNEGQFEDVSQSSGIEDLLGSSDCHSVVAADYDGDGDIDFHVAAHPQDVLLQNQGDGTFEDVTEAAAAVAPVTSGTDNGTDAAAKLSAFGDIDGDGHLDLVVVSSTFDPPEDGEEPIPNGYLLRNRGDGTFEDVTQASNFTAPLSGNPRALLWTDLDSDGDQDLLVWNDRGSSTENRVLLDNQGDGTFADATMAAGLSQSVTNPGGLDAADLNRDGLLDLYVSEAGPNPLLINQGEGQFEDVNDVSGAVNDYGWGTGFADFNADTWPDIFVAQEGSRDHLLFTHLGTEPPTFSRTPIEHPSVGQAAVRVATAFADFDQDGRVDVATATTDGSAVTLYRNVTELGTHRWLTVGVDKTTASAPAAGAEPPATSRGGVTARVVVKTGPLVQFKEIRSGSSAGTQHSLDVTFGLGHRTGADWVGVLWPDGTQHTLLDVAGNQRIQLTVEASAQEIPTGNSGGAGGAEGGSESGGAGSPAAGGAGSQ